MTRANELVSTRGVAPAKDLGVFAFKLLVNGEEMLDFAQHMRLQIRMLPNLLMGGTTNGDC